MACLSVESQGSWGVQGSTARKYAAAESPPVTAPRKFAVALAHTMNNNADGHFR